MRYAQGGGMTPVEQQHREDVRMLAAALFEQRVSTSRIAGQLRVGPRQVEKWRRAWSQGGTEALRSKGPHGVPRLTGPQLARLQVELERGPAVHGWVDDQRWRLARIVALVQELFGVGYTRAGMSLLLHRLGWSVQVPARRSVQRDEHAVVTWTREQWPQAKPSRRPRTAGSCVRTRPGRGCGRRSRGPGPGAGT